ncbi:MAG: hypothetical protein CM15mV5_0140 [uncultured marine virus]|nr:MAG: hypothetical protein CM15mV5_0140 [uncultured marine virus]
MFDWMEQQSGKLSDHKDVYVEERIYHDFRTNVLLFKKVKLNIGMFSTNFDKTVEK